MSKIKAKILLTAEIGHNFNGDITLAKYMIKMAKICGADRAKFQVYNTDTLGIAPERVEVIEDLRKSELTKEQVKELKDECDKNKIEFMASAFDVERVGWLEELGVKRHKIASRSIYDEDLIQAMVNTGKPIIASLGKVDERGIPDIKADFLYCVAKYPPTTMDMLKFPKDFRKYAGFSDHTLGINWTIKAIKRGAKIIEKHFTIDKTMPGRDQAGSAEPRELKKISEFIQIWTTVLNFRT